jgi:putative flippase GtrA
MSGQSGQGIAYPTEAQERHKNILARLLAPRVGAMLVRNTVVSCFVFCIGLALMWGLINLAGVDEVVAAGFGFVVANSLHYALGRSWIFRGTDREIGTGYVLFLINSGVGLLVTVGLYALLLQITGMNYLLARIVVSIVAGLIVFALNALLNFRQA